MCACLFPLQMTARYGGGDGGRDASRLQARCAELEQQKEQLLSEYRRWKECAAREAAAVREQWEIKIAALTDKAFKLADPEVHAYAAHAALELASLQN